MISLRLFKPLCRNILIMILAIGTAGCKNSQPELTFVGDSIVARWDLDEFFPHYWHSNLGLSGSGLNYLQRTLADRRFDDLVILTGTNDNYSFADGHIDSYVSRYVETVTSADAAHVYLYSVLPRNFAGDDTAVNDRIRTFNTLVSRAVAPYPNVTYIDAFDYFYVDGNIDLALYSDRLHLSRDGYEVLSSLLKGLLDK